MGEEEGQFPADLLTLEVEKLPPKRLNNAKSKSKDRRLRLEGVCIGDVVRGQEEVGEG
jgi:hypothetical protein